MPIITTAFPRRRGSEESGLFIASGNWPSAFQDEPAYRRLNEQAMRMLNKAGILVSASRSMHLPEDDLNNILLTSARHPDRNLQLLEGGGLGPDHPVHPAIGETRYIKSITCRLLPNS